MKSSFSVAAIVAFGAVRAEEIIPEVAMVKSEGLGYSEINLMPVSALQSSIIDYSSDVTLLPAPTAVTNDEAEKPPGYWTDE